MYRLRCLLAVIGLSNVSNGTPEGMHHLFCIDHHIEVFGVPEIMKMVL